ncbi:hypothetical protein VHEMI05218 [[Torrubiella] hemipterigena]|uniref:AB hydrolase-1 domain-containing protein n=1 Tax=[Torrubiella] hemipterigena TaxID=1531966 RepID=A0A0A1TGH6_9HYPO|nr:hypothetical protein VHEMI05218 [[Torrubiella] hemipterigena]
MDTSKLKPNDSRVRHVNTTIRGKNVRYILGEPQGTKKDTMVLVHGWPDMAFGWRNQIPYFMSLGYQVVVPDMVGYAGTDAPMELEKYSLKSVAEDIRELAAQFVGEDGQIILGGHDWGGMVVWRTAQWFPKLIKGVFSVCTPFAQSQPQYIPLEAIIESGHLLNFRYQLQLMGSEAQEKLQGRDKMRQLLLALYGARTPEGEVGFSTLDGFYFDRLDRLVSTPLLPEEELEYYTDQYMLRDAPQARGLFNWYRTRPINFEEERPLAEANAKIEMPALFIGATHDDALPRSMGAAMGQHFTNLTRTEVEASHWALTEAAAAVNADVTAWLKKQSLL